MWVIKTFCIWSQSYDFDLQRQRRNDYNATGSLACFENKNILFYFEKRWRCSFKLKVVGLALGPERAQAQAHAGLVFALSPQARPWARPPGQARPAKARARSVKPEPDPSPHFSGPLRPYLAPGFKIPYHSKILVHNNQIQLWPKSFQPKRKIIKSIPKVATLRLCM
jgi:hypothetical protein